MERGLRRDFPGVPAVGDSMRDIEAAQAVGAQPILVRTGKGIYAAEQLKGQFDVPIFDDLASVVDSLLTDEN